MCLCGESERSEMVANSYSFVPREHAGFRCETCFRDYIFLVLVFVTLAYRSVKHGSKMWLRRH